MFVRPASVAGTGGHGPATYVSAPGPDTVNPDTANCVAVAPPGLLTRNVASRNWQAQTVDEIVAGTAVSAAGTSTIVDIPAYASTGPPMHPIPVAVAVNTAVPGAAAVQLQI